MLGSETSIFDWTGLASRAKGWARTWPCKQTMEGCEEVRSHSSQPVCADAHESGRSGNNAALPAAWNTSVRRAEGGLLREVNSQGPNRYRVLDGQACPAYAATGYESPVVQGSVQMAHEPTRSVQGAARSAGGLLDREADQGGRDHRALIRFRSLAQLSRPHLERCCLLAGHRQLRERRQLVRQSWLLPMWPSIRPRLGT